MAILKKNYEISVWEDKVENGVLTEKRVAIIGSDSMTSQYRALEPKLVRNINGSNTFTFKMHRKFYDNMTGEKVENPFIGLINNETKIKLKRGDKWFDLIIKNIQQSSDNSTYTYSASDYHINELSKLGYNLELDSSLMNNSGTLKELAAKVLEGTGWEVDGTSDTPKETVAEYLVEMTYNGAIVWGFYSCCHDQTDLFQYITAKGEKVDFNGVYIEPTEATLTKPAYVLNAASGLYYPEDFTFVGLTNERARRTVYTQPSYYNPTLEKVVSEYKVDGKTVYGFTDIEYVSPILIQNVVSNNTFSSTAGWRGRYYTTDKEKYNNGAKYNVTIEAKTSPDVLEVLKGNEDQADVYTPYLNCSVPALGDSNIAGIIVNSGFYDNNVKIGDIEAGEKYVLYYKLADDSIALPTVYVSDIGYNTSDGCYTTGPATINNLLFQWGDSSAGVKKGEGYYKTATAQKTLTQAELRAAKYQIFIAISNNTDENIELKLEDFQIFKFVDSGNGIPLLPEEQNITPITDTTYYFYDPEENSNTIGAVNTDGNNIYRASRDEYVWLAKDKEIPSGYVPKETFDKIRQPSIKQSNYFNAIQTLCESFEVWADFIIDHDSDGKITGRRVKFQTVVGQRNHAGIRYGANLKSSKRTIESKAVVTKLIVADNVTEYADDGICSISRAAANRSGESYIYNFSYYYSQGLLNSTTMEPILSAHYETLKGYNDAIQTATKQYSQLVSTLSEASAKKQSAEKGLAAAKELLEEKAAEFLVLTKTDYTNYASLGDDVKNNTTVKSCLEEIAEALRSQSIFKAELSTAKANYESYKALNDGYLNTIQSQSTTKAEVVAAFTKQYARFIQEGTWKGTDYLDDDKYYLDALSTSNNSCLPKSTYDFSVLDLSQIEDYEGYTFELGDQTTVTDPDLFGDTPIEVVITEITYNLDEPDKNTLKVQNFRNQFADLFQKMTATTQSVQYASDAWQKAAGFVQSTPAEQGAFLQKALNDAEVVLANAGDQSVVISSEGITVTDLTEPSNQIRMVGGAILLRDDEDDGLNWKTGITAQGISAKLITSGQLDTGVIRVMNGEDPAFRWDKNGLTAYKYSDKTTDKGLVYKSSDAGVRFDKHGIYGFDGSKLAEGASIDDWAPDDEGDIRDKAIFDLTKDGLCVRVENAKHRAYDKNGNKLVLDGVTWTGSTTKFGKVDDFVYNDWDDDGLPYYDATAGGKNKQKFAKVFAVSNDVESKATENLVIYDDGTLVANDIRFTGSVQWSESASPVKNVYAQRNADGSTPSLPANGTKFSDFSESDIWTDETATKAAWHTVLNIENDVVYVHTDNGGKTWEGPFEIDGGKTIQETQVIYALKEGAKTGLTAPELPEGELSTPIGDGWQKDKPEPKPNCWLYVAARDLYTNGKYSAWRVTSSYSGNGIASTTISYAASANGTSHPNNDSTSWEDEVPTVKKGEYLWTRTIITYDDEKTSTSYTVSYQGNDGDKGDTVVTKYLYCLTAGASNTTPPQTPSYNEDSTSLPTGWTQTPTGVSKEKPREYVSQCTVTAGKYGNWSAPVLWAKFGADGSDASVTDENVFDALTKNGDMFGCFTGTNGKLYINAAYLKSGTVTSNITYTGELVADRASVSGEFSGNKIGLMDNDSESSGIQITPESIIGPDAIFSAGRLMGDKLVLKNDEGEAYNSIITTFRDREQGTGTKTKEVTETWSISKSTWSALSSNDVAITVSVSLSEELPQTPTVYTANYTIEYKVGSKTNKKKSSVVIQWGSESVSFPKTQTFYLKGQTFSPVTDIVVSIKGFFGTETFILDFSNGIISTKEQKGSLEYPTTASRLIGYGTEFSSSIRPEQDGVSTLGDTGHNWKRLYTDAISSFGDVFVETSATEAGKYADGKRMRLHSGGIDFWYTEANSDGTAEKWMTNAHGISYNNDKKIEASGNWLFKASPLLEKALILKGSPSSYYQPGDSYIAGNGVATTSVDGAPSSYGGGDAIFFPVSKCILEPSVTNAYVDGFVFKSSSNNNFSVRIGSDIAFYYQHDRIAIFEPRSTQAGGNAVDQRLEISGIIKFLGDVKNSNGGTEITSDRNCKNTISTLSDSYSTLFDNLKPVSYKYNKGTSNRLHTGFIAQEVEEAILAAGLTTQDFAAYVNDGSNEDEARGLRYSEFIALNTHQIQLLKPRMAAAEAEIERLKIEVNQLRCELAALKESQP